MTVTTNEHGQQNIFAKEPTTSYPCIAGFVEDAPGVGTLDFFFPSEFTEDIQSVSEVSVKVAEEITKSIGVC